jgi:hypothetical protein
MIRRALTLACLLVLIPATADAAVTQKKAIWGPTEFEAESMFPTYKDLGAGIYQMELSWDEIALLEPLEADDPLDASYEWPDQIDTAIDEARANKIQVALVVTGKPDWAKRDDPRAYADFLTAAARRYRAVRIWTIGDDPRKSLSGRVYARQLDAAYKALKARSKRNRVVGGNSTGNAAARWIRSLKLANGKAPRMDLYGHSTTRPLTAGDVEALADAAGKRLFLNLTLTANSRQASRLRSALRVARRSSDVFSLGYRGGLFDEGDTKTGLIDVNNEKRAAYTAFKRG